MSARHWQTLNSHDRRALRLRLYARQNGTCAYCDGAMHVHKDRWMDDRYATFDHVTPLARGGGRGPSNIVLACRACNEQKDRQPVEEFVRTIQAKEA